ncbi:armadillo-like helical domain-containing protein 4 isoform X2 [Pristis pectinata]|uniref:armadillo-like helical domain-containing protein 4 isoform X2 n=1 Tax=Pristis pectinata TaxID=685728 RepID=UPI00223E1467|nr:armadillo-like helical domain-containing protein 4 isoform X2 [Pristis pectinata]
MMRSTEFYTCVVTLAMLTCIPELRCSVIRKHHRRNIQIFEGSTAKLEDIKKHNENSDMVTSATVPNGEILSSTASSNNLSSLETFTAGLKTSIVDVEETPQTSKTRNESVITISSLDILLTTTTMVPFQKPLNITIKDENFNKNLQTKQEELTTTSTPNHTVDVSDVRTTTGVTLNDTVTHNAEKTGGTKNSEQMTISTLVSSITNNGSIGETTGTPDSNGENFTLNSHDTTALPLTSQTAQTVSTSQKDVKVLTSEMLHFSEFTNVENLRSEEATTVMSDPVGNSFSWTANSPSAGKEMNEIMATTGSAVTDSKAPNALQVTTTPRVTTAIKEAIITETVPSTSTETAQTMPLTNTAAIIGTTKKMYEGLNERLAVTNGITTVKSALSTTLLSEKPISEVNTDSTREMLSVTPTELKLQPAVASGTKLTQTITAGTTVLQTISTKTKKTSAGASDSTDRTLLLILTTSGPSVGATVPPSSSEDELESEAGARTTALLQQESVDLIRKNISATTAGLSTETSHTTLQTSVTKPMGVMTAMPSVSPPVLRDNMLSTLEVTTSPSIRHSEPPTYMSDTMESEEEDDNEDEEDDEDEDEDIDLDEDSMDYDTEVPSLSYITPGGPIRGNKNLTKMMEMSYQLPDSFEWNQHDQVRSWLEKIKNKAGYMSGMLVPVAVGVAGALFILGALYSLKVMNRKRKNVFKRRETKPRDFTSMQDRVMLLADSSEDEF